MKKAIVVASFGCSIEDSRKKYIEPIENAVRAEYKDINVFRVFTSNIIRAKLKRLYDMDIMNMDECLTMLKEKGYTDVAILTTHIIPGVEYEKLTSAIMIHQKDFDSVKIARPFFDDNMGDTEIQVAYDFISDNKGGDDNCVLVMGHGTKHESNKYYGIFEKKMQEKMDNMHLFNVEWTDLIEEKYDILKAKGYRHIDVYPLMIVAGDHALNDMASDDDDSVKSKLEAKGYEVTAHVKGLGGEKAYHNVCISRLREIL